MKPRTAARTVVVFLLVLGTLMAPGATAQDSVAAIGDKLAEETAAAADDPAAWAAGKTDGNETGDDLRWAVRTACWARDDAEDATGEPVPDPTGLCPTLQDAVAIAAGEDEEEDVAQAEPLDDDTEARTEAYLDETADMVARIAADPATAVAETRGAFDRTLSYLRAVLSSLLGGMGHGIAAVGAAERAGLQALTQTVEDLAWGLRDATVFTVTAPLGLATDTAHGIAAVTAAATDHVATAVADAYDTVRALFGATEGITVGDDGPHPDAAPVPGDLAELDLPDLPQNELGL